MRELSNPFALARLGLWVTDILERTGQHSRASWALLLGTPEDRLEVMKAGVLTPNQLRRLKIIVFSWTHLPAAVVLQERWSEIEKELIDSQLPVYTVGQYALESKWEDFRSTVGSLPVEMQEQILCDGLRRAHQWILNAEAERAGTNAEL